MTGLLFAFLEVDVPAPPTLVPRLLTGLGLPMNPLGMMKLSGPPKVPMSMSL
jgi:xanthosine utilization system XapX-like protein